VPECVTKFKRGLDQYCAERFSRLI